MITRRTALAATAAATLALPALAQPAALSPADQTLVSQAAAYLQALSEAKGRFVQTDARGAVSQGELFLKRPGKARFAYQPPSGLLVVSDGANVSILDSRLKTFSAYPLVTTPLSLFLAREIRLDRGVKVTRVNRLSDGFSITARDGRGKTDGQITLNFASNPITLLGWSVTDAQGQSTRVRIVGLERASGLSPSLFVLKDPRPKNPGRARM